MVTTPLQAQKLYVRVSPNDCINCYIGFFAYTLNNAKKQPFKYLFPEDYKGKRFDQFNKMFFHGKISAHQVVFSDSLYKKTAPSLRNLSGVVLMDKGKVVWAVSAEEIGSNFINLNALFNEGSELHKILNYQEEGITYDSPWCLNFEHNLIVINDELYRKLTFLRGQSVFEIDLKNEVFRKLIKKYVPKKNLPKMTKELTVLTHKLKKKYPLYPFIVPGKRGFHMAYYLFYVKHSKTKKPPIRGAYLRLYAFMNYPQIEAGSLSAVDIVQSSFVSRDTLFDFLDEQSANFAVHKDRMYRLNVFPQTIDSATVSEEPMFTVYRRNKNDSSFVFQGLSDMRGVELQKVYKFRTGVMSLGFLSHNSTLLLKLHPYVFSIQDKKVYKLDWEAGLNAFSNTDIKLSYETYEFWKQGHFFIVLVQKKRNYYLKIYNNKWELKRKIRLPFVYKNIRKLRFTKDFIYFMMGNDLMALPNILTIDKLTAGLNVSSN